AVWEALSAPSCKVMSGDQEGTQGVPESSKSICTTLLEEQSRTLSMLKDFFQEAYKDLPASCIGTLLNAREEFNKASGCEGNSIPHDSALLCTIINSIGVGL